MTSIWRKAYHTILYSQHGLTRLSIQTSVSRKVCLSSTTNAYGITKCCITRRDHNNYRKSLRYFSGNHPNSHRSSKNDEKKISAKTSSSDPPVWTWVERTLPLNMQPYARLARMDKPIGTMLLLWPCFWSTAIAAEQLPDPYLLGLFTIGAFTMRGAGCTINDLWDQDIDRKVIRTSTRPMASGELTQIQAITFLAGQLTVGLAVLLSLPNTWYCFQWGCMSLPLVAIYPATKRFFPYPQAILGMTFNWGTIMGWAAVHGSIDYTIIGPLYLSGVTWTIVYDTIYAHQDKNDDAKLNLQSTALTFGASETKQRLILNGFAAATLASWLTVGNQADLSLPYYVGASVAYGHLVWQIQTAEFDNPYNLADRFRSNSTVGAIMFGALVAGRYF